MFGILQEKKKKKKQKTESALEALLTRKESYEGLDELQNTSCQNTEIVQALSNEELEKRRNFE